MIRKLFSIFDGYPYLEVGFSARNFGTMKPTGHGGIDKKIKDNWREFLKSLDIDISNLVSLNQVHDDNIKIVNSGEEFIKATDSLLTNKRNVYLSIRVADCLPIYLFESINNIIGLIHAGWRGIAKNIIDETIKQAKNKLGLGPQETIVGIGPSICKNHFEVKEDVASEFKDYPESVIRRSRKIFVDLKSITKKQLVEAGIKEENIEISPICTFEDKNYFSNRRDRPKHVEAMMAIIGLKA